MQSRNALQRLNALGFFFPFSYYCDSKTAIVPQPVTHVLKAVIMSMRRLAVRCCASGWGAQSTVEMIIALITVIMTITAPTG